MANAFRGVLQWMREGAVARHLYIFWVEGILGVCSVLHRSESIRDINFEYVDRSVAVNNPLR